VPSRNGVKRETRDDYILGHSDVEHTRLGIQSAYLRPLTTRYLRMAGLTQGMSVLDIGSGLGHVSQIAAEIVGPSGRVVGVERNEAAVTEARRRTSSEGFSDHVRFERADLDDFDTVEKYDALIGRFILMYQPDPAGTLRRLLPFVRPDGIVMIHELDFSDLDASFPVCEIWNKAFALPGKLLRAGGLHDNFGRQLVRIFLDAGLPWPDAESSTLTGGKPGSAIFSWLSSAVQSIAPQLATLGIELPADVPADEGLTAILEQAVLQSGSLVRGAGQYGAWARVPGY
jgi:SAM-dependent methyltransferase